MNPIAFAAALVGALTLVACAEVSTPDAEEVNASTAGLVRPEALVGKWRFDLGDERRAAFYAQIERENSDPAEQKKRKANLEAEVEASILEFDDQGVFHSRVFDKELIAVPYTAKPVSATSVLVTQQSGKSVTIDFVGADTIVVNDPKKGALTYHRE